MRCGLSATGSVNSKPKKTMKKIIIKAAQVLEAKIADRLLHLNKEAIALANSVRRCFDSRGEAMRYAWDYVKEAVSREKRIILRLISDTFNQVLELPLEVCKGIDTIHNIFNGVQILLR